MKEHRSPFQLSVKTISIEYDSTVDLEGKTLNTPEVAACYIIGWNRSNGNPVDQECFSVFGLDQEHRLISAETLTKGTGNQAPVDPCRLFRHLIGVGAVGFIVSHNHPSGGLNPSTADEALTRKLYKAGQLIGLPLQDHILTTPNDGWVSFRHKRPELWERII